jgi:hypothetical protein
LLLPVGVADEAAAMGPLLLCGKAANSSEKYHGRLSLDAFDV